MSLLQDPTEFFGRYSALAERRKNAQNEIYKNQILLHELDEFLGLEGKVLLALDQLDSQLFKEITALLEDKLSIALQEVLEQSIRLKVESVVSNKTIGFEFSIDRDGHEEHILKGCGGSVANILSVGLRLFALTCLSEERHRRFLVLDEQDCWIQPELIPSFIKIISEAARALNFQILMISHHDPALFFDQADRVFKLESHPDGIQVRVLEMSPQEPD